MACGAEMKEPSARAVTFSRARRRALALVLAGGELTGLSACAGSVGPDSPSTPSAAAPAAPTAEKDKPVRREKEAQPVPVPDLFDRGARVDFVLGADLLLAVPQKFSRTDLANRKLRLAPTAAASNLWLAVDHHAPRRARSSSFTIAELINEDVELAPGSHYLVAFEWGAEGHQRFQLAAFFVDVEPTTLPLSPGCLLATPLLTKNGPDAERPLEFLAIPLVASIDRVEYYAEIGDLRSTGAAPVGVKMSWKGLPGGDVTVAADCFSGEEKVGADYQVITLNPEAFVPEARP